MYILMCVHWECSLLSNESPYFSKDATNEQKNTEFFCTMCVICVRACECEREQKWMNKKKQPHTRATAAATAHNQIRNRRPIEIHAMKWTMCCLEFYSWRKIFSYIYAYVLVCMQIGRRRRLSLARAQTAIKHKIREEDSKWSKAKKHLNPHNGYCVHIQLWMTFTRFVQYIESIQRSCLLVGWLVSQFLFSSSISLYLSISLVPVWLFLIYACTLCCFFCFTIHCCVFQFHTVCEWCCFLLFAVPFSFYILVFRLDLTNSESTTTTTYIKVHAYRHIGIVYTFLLLGLAWTGLC